MIYNLQKIRKDFNAGKKQKFLFFWGHQKSQSGDIGKECLSQWWPAQFIMAGITYFSAEHYMMAEKARLFNDTEHLDKIIHAKSPGQAKAFGRMVNGFDEDVWVKYRYEIVRRGNMAKFGQNPALQEFLLSTKNRILVEASPVDSIWGIGLSQENEHCQNPLKWKGLNLLGFALMEVREMLVQNI